MPTSLSLLAVLSALAIAVAGASLIAVVLLCIAGVVWEVYVTGSSRNGVG